ncbi:AIPR family protein [Gemella haemolysans]|uniref:Abortive phage infection protein C-terminal domain-containing protein n=2 Tax=Gemella haemolysans TaxID=1379 RepID=A0AA87DRQ4_9BACL|nr:AIPR family protein [Gemella haemolysans]EGF88110.1 hypothetical protein HMPREF0428_01225 [Gemella haemolysans M341]QIX88543.1 hypothetical protein FOC48_07075 [Gemella haemolysans]
MEQRKEKILSLCQDLNLAEGKQTEEYLFTLEMVNLFYYKGNIGKIDIKTGFTDGTGDGGIDFIYTDDEVMYLIQGKSSENLTIEDISNVFYKIKNTVENFENESYAQYSKKLKSIYKNAYDGLDNDKNIEFVLFTNTKLNESILKKIDELKNKKEFSSFDITIYDKEDINRHEVISYSDRDLVEEDAIKIFLNNGNKNDMLAYGENGIIVNVKATSIKSLYEKHSENGLFSYNLREHVADKSVDEGIEQTIKNDKDNFWFYNNGITIGCEDFRKDGDKIKLYNFSIINGAQTTTKLGKSKLIDGKHDFSLVCKIVKSDLISEETKNFISKISEASNSQKPIKLRDLKSNDLQQLKLERGAASNKYPLAIEIKRGVKAKNYNKVREKWQRVTNEYIGQLILSCILQKPGLARNSKNTIFSSKKLYTQVFVRDHDFDTLYDLVRLGNIYTEYSNREIKEMNDLDTIGIMRNGKLTILAIVCYLIKKQKREVIDYTSEEVYKDNLTGLLFTDYPKDDLILKLEDLFSFIIEKLQKIYEIKKGSEKITSYSNFFKNEKMYEIIIREFDDNYLKNIEKKMLRELLYVFTEKKINEY